jgi:hypothetical protein
MNRNGRIGKIMVRKGEDALFKGTVKLILGDLQTILDDKEKGRWETKESDQYGSYQGTYEQHSGFFSAPTITKKKDSYHTLLAIPRGLDNLKQQSDGGFDIHFSTSGYIDRFSGKIEVSVTSQNGSVPFRTASTIDMKLRSVKHSSETFSIGGESSTETLILGKVEIDEAKRRELLEKRADKLTSSEMAGLIHDYAMRAEDDGEGSPEWRVSAYLRLHPEKCAELAPIFQGKDMISKGRLFVFGALVSTGNPEAQKVMRELLGTEAAKKEGMYSIYLQNFGQLEHPDKETVDFITSKYEQAKQEGRYRESTALTLGATVANLNKAGDTANAARLNNDLLKDLAAAKGRYEQELMLDSVGNAGMVSNIATVAEYIKSPDERIRASVAGAVRRTQTEESEKMLFDLVRDKETLVQKQAVNALAGYSLDKQHMEQIRDGVKSGGIGPNAYYETLQLFTRHSQERGVMKETLQEMKKRAPDDPHLLSRINQMLGQ